MAGIRGSQCKKLWWTNMILLGLQPAALEDRYKVVFNADMFESINRKGSEVVLHCLLTVLDTDIASQRFRDCWPILDRRQEQEYRKVCGKWIGDIAKDHPETRLQRLCASLLLSPGGEKYYVFLYKLSKYVLLKDTLSTAEQCGVSVSSFLTNGLTEVVHREIATAALKAHIRHQIRYITDGLHTQTQLHGKWTQDSSWLVEEYQRECKKTTSLKKQLQSVMEDHQTRAGRVPQSKAEERVWSLGAKVTDKQRTARMDKTREMWMSVERFITESSRQRAVVDSVMRGSNSDCVDAAHLNIHVPDSLMSDYEHMVNTGAVQPLYHDGKLNLISLTKLYNCALRQYREAIRQNGLPSVDHEGMRHTAQQQKALLTTCLELRHNLRCLKESLTTSIPRRLTELQERGTQQTSPSCVFREGRAPVLIVTPVVQSVGLLPPSPARPKPLPLDHTHQRESKQQRMTPLPRPSSPETMDDLLKSITEAATAKTHIETADVSTFEPTKPVSKRNTQPTTKAPKQQTTVKVTKEPSKEPSTVTKQPPPIAKQTVPRPQAGNQQVTEQVTPTLSYGSKVKGHSAYDILAEQIADSVSAQSEQQMLMEPSPATPDLELHSVTDPLAALGHSAFVSKDCIPRTPLAKPPLARTSATLSPLTESPMGGSPQLLTTPTTTSDDHVLITKPLISFETPVRLPVVMTTTPTVTPVTMTTPVWLADVDPPTPCSDEDMTFDLSSELEDGVLDLSSADTT